MKNNYTEIQNDFFSTDPEENLRIENEILHLKLKAELGGEVRGIEPVPPDIQNKFLQNILEFEHAYANAAEIRIYEFLGEPSFVASNQLNDEEIIPALEKLYQLLEEKSIMLDFSGNYDERLKYTFITQEFFERTIEDVQIDGYITHYSYETFHPNHRLDIESRAVEFIMGWLNKEMGEDNWELADSIILPDGHILAKQEVLATINTSFKAYPEFCNSLYSIEEITFDLQEATETGIGSASGFVSYELQRANGEHEVISGSFKIYLALAYNWWSIFYFVFPGFSWSKPSEKIVA